MRARLAIWAAGISVELREVSLRDKPQALRDASPKATVPVLVDGDRVIDESFEIMLWALRRHDPGNWLGDHEESLSPSEAWVRENDLIFKPRLDRYKYFERYPEESQLVYRARAEEFLAKLEEALRNGALLGGHLTLADFSLLPFVRQFALVDRTWFDQAPYPLVRAWLDDFLGSPLFRTIMEKNPVWRL